MDYTPKLLVRLVARCFSVLPCTEKPTSEKKMCVCFQPERNGLWNTRLTLSQSITSENLSKGTSVSFLVPRVTAWSTEPQTEGGKLTTPD